MFNVYEITNRPVIEGPDAPVQITQNEWEFSVLLEVYKDLAPFNVLEVGTHYGGTLYHWVQNAPESSLVVSVDDYQLNEDQYKDWIPHDTSRVVSIQGKSQNKEVIKRVIEQAPFYDFIFIDAGHGYDEVKADWENYGKLTKRGSIVAFHDITPHRFRGVDQLWREIQAQGYITQELITPGADVGIGIVYL